MTEKEQFETIKDCMLTKGAELLLEQIQEHKDASDTILVPKEDMEMRCGYVQALVWIQGLMEQYKNISWEEISGEDE